MTGFMLTLAMPGTQAKCKPCDRKRTTQMQEIIKVLTLIISCRMSILNELS